MNEAKLMAHQNIQSEAGRSLESLANQQAVRPFQDIQRLRDDFWPEDESAEAFVQAVRHWRREEVRR